MENTSEITLQTYLKSVCLSIYVQVFQVVYYLPVFDKMLYTFFFCPFICLSFLIPLFQQYLFRSTNYGADSRSPVQKLERSLLCSLPSIVNQRSPVHKLLLYCISLLLCYSDVQAGGLYTGKLRFSAPSKAVGGTLNKYFRT